jgi:hypothetical protein
MGSVNSLQIEAIRSSSFFLLSVKIRARRSTSHLPIGTAIPKMITPIRLVILDQKSKVQKLDSPDTYNSI